MTHDAFYLSDVGLVREHNEDDAVVLPEEGVYIVADGMGGHACGEVASHLSVSAIEAFYADQELKHSLREEFKAIKEHAADDAGRTFQEYRLRTAFEHGNRKIYQHATTDARLADMGTTIVGLAFSGARVYVAHVGDSRAYRWRGGELLQLTEDHSLANEFLRLKILRIEDLPEFPYRNVIMRALGLQPQVKVETSYRTVKPLDRYLLCSDGLTDLVTDEDIAEVLASVEGASETAYELVERALNHGGIDNITVMIIDIRS
jgi:serine/threonine protein phosphatase PrpC